MQRFALALVLCLLSSSTAWATQYVAIANGTFTSASTWSTPNTGTGTLVTTTANSYNQIDTNNRDSSAFTPAAQASQFLAIKVAQRNAGVATGKLTVILRNVTTATNVWTFVININDILSCAVGTDDCGWYLFDAGTPLTPNGTDTYLVRMIVDDTSTPLYISNDAVTNYNWCRAFLQVAAAAAPGAGDRMIVGGRWNTTNPSVKTTVTVTMNNTTTTDFGDNSGNGNNNDLSRMPSLSVGNGGVFAYATTPSVNLVFKISGYIVICQGGTFTQGAPGAPIPRSSTAKLIIDTDIDGKFGLYVRGGTRYAEGESPSASTNQMWGLLAADAAAGATTVTVDRQIAALNGSDVGFFSTNTGNNHNTWEFRTLTADATATTLTFSAALTNPHAGHTDIQGEVVALTRNVQIIGGSAAFASFEYWAPGTTTSVKWASWQYMGDVNQSSLPAIGVSNNGAVISYCVFRDTRHAAIYIYGATTSVTVSHVIGFNVGTQYGNGAFYAQSAATGVSFDDIVTSSANNAHGMEFQSVGSIVKLDNLRLSGWNFGIIIGSNPAGVLERTVALVPFNNWVIHSQTNGYGVSMGTTSHFRLNNYTAWGYGVWGFSFARVTDMVLDGFAIYDSGTTGNADIYFAGSNTDVNVTLRNGKLGKHTGATSGYSLYLENGAQVSGLRMENVTMTGASNGAGWVNNQGDVVYGGGANMWMDATFDNVTFQNTNTGPTNGWWSGSCCASASAAHGSRLAYVRRNGVVGDEVVDVYKYGTLYREASTFDGAAPSLRMAPQSTTFKMDTSGLARNKGWLVPVAAGQTPTVSVKLQKDATYNGAAPRLILKNNASLGLVDTVIATCTVTVGGWTKCTGTAPAAAAQGVEEFVVDCDGTAGNLYVDTFAVSGAGAADPNGLAYALDGLPHVFTGSNAGGGGSAYAPLTHTAKEIGTTPAIDTTGATLIVVAEGNGGTPSTITDSMGNQWSKAPETGSGANYVALFYCFNPITSPTHTFTGFGTYNSLAVAAFSGGPVAAGSRTLLGGASPGTSITLPALTPSVANALVVTAYSSGTATTLTVNQGFTITDQIGGSTGQKIALAYLIQTAPLAVNPTWTSSNSQSGAGVLHTFVIPAGPSTGGGETSLPF